ncbi:MAG: T9SS type A sorting domain-containing protein [Lewinella sp.]|uniref:T9SS type A sorting domain-containing protein n=1 Tax=Lewinella sp. TaxID=2004506 RepID=UPI003D6B2383
MQLKNYVIALFCLSLTTFGLQAQDFFTESFTSDGGVPTGWMNVEVAGNGTPSASWLFGTDGPTGPFATDLIASTTATDGWATFDSDLNCSQTVQDAWLISPAIDASDKAAVWLIFETLYRSFNDRPQIRVGTDLDDLASWETFEVFPGIAANDFGGILDGDPAQNPQTIQLDLSAAAAGVNNVYVAFQFLSDGGTANGGNLTACGYSWQVDDMVLTETDPRPANEMRVNAFAAVAPNALTPASQVEPIGFIADIANAGSATQATVTLNMTITNNAGAEVYNDEIVYTDIVSDSTAENVLFPTEFTPPAVADIYTATYSLSYDGDDMDAIPGNNTNQFVFSVTDTLFAKEIGSTRGVSPADDDSYTYGNVYTINSDMTLEGEPLHARTISFGVTNADELAGRFVTVLLLEWPEDANESFIAEQDEYTIYGFNSYEFTGNEGDGLITVMANEDGPLPLTEGFNYIAAIQYSTDDDQAMFLQASEDYDYAAMTFYTDSLDRIRYSAALDVSNEGDLSMTGFGQDIVPVVRLSVGNDVVTSTSEVELPTGAVSVFPNPANTYVNLDFDLEEQTSGRLVVFNTKGQVIINRTLDNVMKERIQLETAGLPSGTYLIRVDTELGVSNRMITVQH